MIGHPLPDIVRMPHVEGPVLSALHNVSVIHLPSLTGDLPVAEDDGTLSQTELTAQILHRTRFNVAEVHFPLEPLPVRTQDIIGLSECQ